MKKMTTAIRLIRPQPPAWIFTPPLPSNLGRKASGVRFKQAASVDVSSEPESENGNMDKQQDKPTEKTGDLLSHSFGEGYASRCDDEGFGGIYGGNQSLPKTEHGQLVHENHPVYDKSQGSEVKEKEKARHQTDASS
ncbi:hypothetical protein ACFX13_018775 [Malus domestica]|uniref:Uncharacterized protein n=1 Tax=Malus domestica TaxID=3750 RepID=A0A498HYU5_MALDO|nr:uncharacterized protein LOC103415969 [Malus domestica]RXH75152.1 hypothetical protein DVH24_029873 [Malus domestica]